MPTAGLLQLTFSTRLSPHAAGTRTHSSVAETSLRTLVLVPHPMFANPLAVLFPDQVTLRAACPARSEPHVHLHTSFLQQPGLRLAAWQWHGCVQHQLSTAKGGSSDSSKRQTNKPSGKGRRLSAHGSPCPTEHFTPHMTAGTWLAALHTASTWGIT